MAGTSVNDALPVTVASATLVAVTVTVCGLDTVAGAVYSPALVIVPTAGLTDHCTPELVSPVTAAVNCNVCAPNSVADAGPTLTCAAVNMVTDACAVFVGSAWLAAMTVTVCGLLIEAGAV